MNANELADKLQMDKARALLYVDTVVEAATMLRQQQAEIEALKILVDELAGYKASYENCHRACNGYGMN